FTTAPAHATITNLIAANESGEPLDESITTITDEDNLWAYVTSPSGGFIRVVPADCTSDCVTGGGAWGAAPVTPFFAGYVPVAPAPLRPGLWKLVGVGPGGNVEIESQVFRIDVCTGACTTAPKPDPSVAKSVFKAMYDSVS